MAGALDANPAEFLRLSAKSESRCRLLRIVRRYAVVTPSNVMVSRTAITAPAVVSCD